MHTYKTSRKGLAIKLPKEFRYLSYNFLAEICDVALLWPFVKTKVLFLLPLLKIVRNQTPLGSNSCFFGSFGTWSALGYKAPSKVGEKLTCHGVRGYPVKVSILLSNAG